MKAPVERTDVEPGVHLGSVVHILARRKLAFVVPLATAGLIGWSVAAHDVKTYTATSMVVLDARKVQVVDITSVVSQLPQDSAALRSEMDIISSRSVAERVAQRLEATAPPQAPAIPLWARPLRQLDQTFDLEWLHGLVRALKIAPASTGKDDPADDLLNNLRVSNDGRSYTIKIAFTSPQPEYSALVANLFAEEYIDHQVQGKTARAQEATSWLGSRANELRAALESSELAIERVRAENGISGSKGVRPEENQLAAMEQNLNEVRARRLEAEARLATLRQAAAYSSPGELSPALGSELLVKLREQESAARKQVEELRGLGTTRHPDWPRLNAALDVIKVQIQEEMSRLIARQSNEVSAAAAQEAMLGNSIARLVKQQGREGAANVRIRQLMREADANRVIYETFLNRYKQTIEQVGFQEADGKIVSRAETPSAPDRSRFVPILAISVLCGLIGGSLLVTMREHFDRTLRDPDSTERTTGLPVIGVVPALAAPWPTWANDLRTPTPAQNEALRLAYLTMRRDRAPGQDARTIMVTSAMPREGKTAFCLSLARMLRKDGRRVLVLDADLRGTRVGRSQGIDPSALNEVLVGARALPDAVRIEKFSGAHYLGVLARCPNPQGILASAAFGHLLELCTNAYDTVIIDSPALSAVADAAMVGALADVNLFMVREGHTDGEQARRALRQLDLSGVHIHGVIVNRPEKRALVAWVREAALAAQALAGRTFRSKEAW
ncbi:MAG TPA: polysaccharide biosynthesis tyrosine autokinase [Magnetospirillum sp.]|nr:polysaccharide biosynthesis tyrosine autokinase [Magnetospirillum sp.]